MESAYPGSPQHFARLTRRGRVVDVCAYDTPSGCRLLVPFVEHWVYSERLLRGGGRRGR